VVFGGISIKAIKLILSVFIVGMLVAVGAAFDGSHDGAYDHSYDGAYDHSYDGGNHKDFGDYHQDHDWLNPGGVVYSYSWWNPNYYDYTWYPAYNYYYTTPVVYPTYTYNPVVYNYDPWWATNAYGGWTGSSYYYSSSWSWSSYRGGYFF
jgi:hypothetical protein